MSQMPDADTIRAAARLWTSGTRSYAAISRILRVPVSTVVLALRASGYPKCPEDRPNGKTTRNRAPRGVTRRRVLDLLRAGHIAPDICGMLGLRMNTVRYHMRHLGTLIDALDYPEEDTHEAA